MKTINLPGVFRRSQVKLFDSTKELNIERHHEFQKLVLQDVGIGSDMDSVARHFSTLHHLLGNDSPGEAVQETKNLHNNVFYMIDKINIKSFCFVAFVDSVDGRKVTDFSESGVRETIKKLSDMGLKQSDVEEILEDLKKNLKKSFNPTFLIDLEDLEQ